MDFVLFYQLEDFLNLNLTGIILKNLRIYPDTTWFKNIYILNFTSRRKIHQKLNSRFVCIQHAYSKIVWWQISTYLVLRPIYFLNRSSFEVKPLQYVLVNSLPFPLWTVYRINIFVLLFPRKDRCFVSLIFYSQIYFLSLILFYFFFGNIKNRDEIYTRPFICSVTYWLKYNSADTSFLIEHFLGYVYLRI